MYPRHCSVVLACLLLFSLAAWAQTDATSPGPRDKSGGFDVTPPADSNTGLGTVQVPSQAADQEGKIHFRSQTILVQVPVVVTDTTGNHVHGLTKRDFRVFEGGKEQEVATLEEIVTTNKQLSMAPPIPGEFRNLTLPDRPPLPVTVIVLDTINTPLLDQANGRLELVKYLADNLNSNQFLALMMAGSYGVRIVQGLTNDPKKLMQVLEKSKGDLPAMFGLGPDIQANAFAGDIPDIPTSVGNPFAAAAAGAAHGETLTAQFQQQRAIEETLSAFLEIAWSLSGVPGRKSLIWATGGFPLQIGGNLSTLYQRAMQALDAAQISVYPVDVRGLVGIEGPAAVISSTVAKFEHQLGNRAALQQSLFDTFNELADMTGGKAFYNTNDLASSFRLAADDASSYYLATYYLNTRNNNSGWREIKVKVDKPGTEVRARAGFFVTRATMDPDLTRKSDLAYALRSPIDGTGLPLSVKWLGTSGNGAKKKTEFVIHLPPGSVSMEGGNGGNHLNLDYAAAAYVNDGKNGRAALTVDKTLTTSIPGAQLASLRSNGIDIKNALELGPGQYIVRVVIRDNLTGKIGSVTAPLTVN